MDLRFTAEEAAFREEVRTFFRTEIPAQLRRKVAEGRHLDKQDVVISQRILNAKGWAVPHWPPAFGGQGWSPIQLYIFTEELQHNAVPSPLQFNVHMIGPVLATFGSAAQKARFLPRIANLDDWWCQGFSEPGAGSDLASLKTTAVRDGNDYLVSGQKTWTTLAQHADWMFCLARTDRAAKKQEGISFLLIDMRSPGVTVRPIITIDGAHEVNEVFLDEVRVPAENLVGEENKGWTYAKFLLGHERVSIARVGMSKQRLERVKELARTVCCAGATLWDDVDFRRRVALAEVELKALELTQMRVVAAHGRDHDKPDPASSILKIKGSELQQLTTELLLEVAGPYAAAYGERGGGWNEPSDADWVDALAPLYFNWRKVSIYGGSNEIQRSIIAKQILGL